jgi:hypothetical protein
MRAMNYIQRAIAMMAVMFTVVLSSCAVHEWPEEKKPEYYKFMLNLDYSTELPLYQIVEHQMSRAEIEDFYDVRYTIEVYMNRYERSSSYELIERKVVNRDDVTTSLNHSVEMMLKPGKYMFKVWTDYVDANSIEHRFYNTDDFNAIVYYGKYEANNDFRDAFVGSLEAEVTENTTVLTVPNERPLAKFNFITTDLEEFVEHMLELKSKEDEENEAEAEDSENNSVTPEDDSENKTPIDEGPTRVIDISDYKIVFTYVSNLPNEFHVFQNEPVDVANPKTIWFESSIKKLNDNEAELGFDYVMSGDKLTVDVVIEVRDKEGNTLSQTSKIPIPLERSKLTTIRGKFLTTQASGGIGINPGFDGPDFIYEAD